MRPRDNLGDVLHRSVKPPVVAIISLTRGISLALFIHVLMRRLRSGDPADSGRASSALSHTRLPPCPVRRDRVLPSGRGGGRGSDSGRGGSSLSGTSGCRAFRSGTRLPGDSRWRARPPLALRASTPACLPGARLPLAAWPGVRPCSLGHPSPCLPIAGAFHVSASSPVICLPLVPPSGMGWSCGLLATHAAQILHPLPLSGHCSGSPRGP